MGGSGGVGTGEVGGRSGRVERGGGKRKGHSVKQLLQGNTGVIAAVVLLLLGGGAMYWTVFAGDGRSDLAEDNSNIWFVDEAGQSFKVRLTVGMSAQIERNGKKAYPAELCFWTKDGKPKTTPTPVLLNSNLGKSEPTFCPDCGRLVVGRNPPAREGANPPPTEAEYKARRESRQGE